MPLRVHVHKQHSFPLAGKESRKVDRRDGLSAPAFLVHDSYRAHDPFPPVMAHAERTVTKAALSYNYYFGVWT
jgi:hypothetical protein